MKKDEEKHHGVTGPTERNLLRGLGVSVVILLP